MASSGSFMALAPLGLEEPDRLALRKAVHARGHDQVARRQPARHADAADHGLAQRHLLPMHGLRSASFTTQTKLPLASSGEKAAESGMTTPLSWLGDLGARLAAHAAGHARQDGDALRRREQELDRVGPRALGRLGADLAHLRGDLDAREGIERGPDIDHVRDERDQRFRHVDDHLDLRRVDEAHDRLLRLDLLEGLGEYSADDARKGRAQLGVAEIELGALLQRPPAT